MTPRQRAQVDLLIAGSEISAASVTRRTREGQVRAEVREDLVSCLRTQGGGSSNAFLLLAGRQRAQVRRFTPREFLRLQGAAEFAHRGSATLVRPALGDAVCVDALAWLAERYLNPLLAETIAETIAERIAASSMESITERSDQDE